MSTKTDELAKRIRELDKRLEEAAGRRLVLHKELEAFEASDMYRGYYSRLKASADEMNSIVRLIHDAEHDLLLAAREES